MLTRPLLVGTLPSECIAWSRRRLTAGLAASVALLAVHAPAQPAQTGPRPSATERVVVSFEQRSRVEALSNPFRIDELGPTRVVAFRTRLRLELRRIVGPIGAFVELQDSRAAWNDRPFIVAAQHVNHLDFKQALVRAGSEHLFGGPLSGGVQVGRFTLDLGSRRLVARNVMRNTTNAFDGAYGWLATTDGSSLEAFVTRPVLLDPDTLDRSDGRRVFWGVSLSLRHRRGLQAEAYALRLDESGETVTGRRLTTLGGRFYKDPSPGELHYDLEGAWQTGTTMGLDHDAHLVHVETGYSLRRARTRLNVLFDRASGDADPEDDRWERFDTLFGARAFEYAPTGIYGPFFRSNIEGPGARLLAAPTARSEIMAGYRALWLSQARDAWFGSGLQDTTGAAGRFLGHHLEARFGWRARRWLRVEAAWGHFFKGSYLGRVPGSPRTPDSDYFTAGLELGGILLAR
jgi:hypothetical protein